ncbi:unnamed protein product [Darwinula stevensoni]|uniref:MYG1 protein n=1 Tax=Darwinula stevensoni TaxID=69355 RepID=A0A7R9FSU9_9CRUS|nr:unnamed protein product [Darwinula stevensoni]CAG0903346.1 unnamed protein product [Darwinula stevensoni]
MVQTPEPAAKKPKGDIPKIGTHNGTFHCDEALACFQLKLLPEYHNAEIVRSRDESVLSTCDVVVDVGGKHDPESLRFDHHQKSFTAGLSTLRPGKKWTTRLSSAGLVFNHFGHRIISQVLDCPVEDPRVEIIFDKVYENLIEEIDAMDNGVDICEGTPRYRITTNLSSRVRRLNPPWTDKDTNTDDVFPKAMQMTGEEFLDRIHYYGELWWPAREMLLKVVEARFQVGSFQAMSSLRLENWSYSKRLSQVDKSGKIMEMSSGGFPWKEHFFDLEEQGIIPKNELFFVIFTDTAGMWRVQAIPVSADSYSSRLPLLAEWRGVFNPELEEKSGLPGIKFVHATGFIGGHETREGAIAMAKKTLASQPETDKK